jgi:hypothetical protein
VLPHNAANKLQGNWMPARGCPRRRGCQHTPLRLVLPSHRIISIDSINHATWNLNEGNPGLCIRVATEAFPVLARSGLGHPTPIHRIRSYPAPWASPSQPGGLTSGLCFAHAVVFCQHVLDNRSKSVIAYNYVNT